MSNLLADSDPRLQSLCHLGEGEQCCRWLARGPRGFFCAKLETDLAPYIAQSFADGYLRARGDHCPGLPPCSRCETLEALLRAVRPYLNRYEESSFLGELYAQSVPPTGVLGEIVKRIDIAVPPRAEKSPPAGST